MIGKFRGYNQLFSLNLQLHTLLLVDLTATVTADLTTDITDTVTVVTVDMEAMADMEVTADTEVMGAMVDMEAMVDMVMEAMVDMVIIDVSRFRSANVCISLQYIDTSIVLNDSLFSDALVLRWD